MSFFKRATTVPAPLVVTPSQSFEGDDGSWSTINLQVGTPPQTFHVLVSTASSETWVPLPDGCTSSDVPNCPALRGVQPFNGRSPEGFLVNQSSTWNFEGLYSLDLEKDLGYSGNGQYGTDIVALNGGNGSSTNGVSLNQQLVAGIAAKDYFLGIFGLGVRPTSFSSSSPTVPSFMQQMKTLNLIPSLSYGYTAGAVYRNKKVLSNLVLGGYDQSRFKNTTQTFTFSSQDSDSLTVGVQSIVATNTLIGTTSFTATAGGHLSVIDSTVPHLWLPQAICDQMEKALGLTYDPQSDLYLVNDTIHTQLAANNPTFTFKLGNTAYDNGNATNIQLPYGAFDLKVGWPIYSTDQNYFPIRRAANDTQYTLGRTLLQEAYIVVDYERRNFTIGQAVFPDPLPSQRIVTITSKGTQPSSGSSGISTGAIIGIVVAAGLLIVALVAGFIWWRRKKSKREQPGELDDTQTAQASKTDYKYQPGEEGATEMYAGGENQISELATPTTGRHDHKDRPQSFAAELPSPQPVFEMMGDTGYTGGGTPPPQQRGPSPYQRTPNR